MRAESNNASAADGTAKNAPAKDKTAASEKTRAEPGPNAKPDSGEKAIRATADEFAKAFNAGDAKAIGSLWVDDAEYTDEAGQTLRGREAIVKEYAALFKQRPGATLELTIDSVRFPAPDVAIEKGIARVKSPVQRSESVSRYDVLHVQRDGRWLMSVARDDPYVPTTNEDSLKELAWLIGDWQPEGNDRGPHLKCEWLAQKNFIRNTITSVAADKATVSSVQIIGWNPKLHAIVSWHFEANGGFGDDMWTFDAAKWMIEASGIGRDGSESSAVNVLTPIDANSFGWQSVQRTLNGAPLPDTTFVKMVRVPASKPVSTPKS